MKNKNDYKPTAVSVTAVKQKVRLLPHLLLKLIQFIVV